MNISDIFDKLNKFRAEYDSDPESISITPKEYEELKTQMDLLGVEFGQIERIAGIRVKIIT